MAGLPATSGPERASTLDITLEFLRAENAGNPFAFRYGEQMYAVRKEGGAVESAALFWDDELDAALKAFGRSRPDPVAQAYLGERLRAFVAQADWGVHEQAIAAALRDGRRIEITLRFAAAELYLLPWELLTLKASGQHLGELPDCLIRYEWPGSESAPPKPDPPPEEGRILFAWSAAGGAVPVRDHLEAIQRACAEGHYPFDPERDVLPQVSLASLSAKLAAPGPPISVLHLLCHGGRLDSSAEAYGLVWNASPEGGSALIDGGAVKGLIGSHSRLPRLVVLAACDTGNAGAPGNALGPVAHIPNNSNFLEPMASEHARPANG